MVWASRENVRDKFATKSPIMGTREKTQERKSKKMVRRMDGWMGGWKKIVTQSVMTDEDIRDRGAWRGLVFGEEKHCSVASP